MRNLTFRISDEDQHDLDAITKAMAEASGVNLKPSDILRMLIREEFRRRQAYGPHRLRDIVCRRTADGGALVTGIRQDWVLHSPTGFEWGYLGGGPADLALNILLFATGDRDFARQHYMRYRNEVVGWIPKEGGELGAAEVLEWVARFREDDRATNAVSRRAAIGPEQT
ncbi:MAG: hypothetical protein F4Y47_20910 [Acidobacteriia bacterium]|nr:hypothetical protein [Terriglobia bacterium]MYK10722.1 hypothetical protein [Terriglobia bacterium]